MSAQDTKNPCVGVCRFDKDATCVACHRTKTEVKEWKRLPDTAKAAINQRVRTQGGTGRLREKRLRKLDKKIRKLETKLGLLHAERADLSKDGVK